MNGLLTNNRHFTIFLAKQKYSEFFLVLSRSRPRWPQRLAAATRVGHRPVPGAATEPQHCRILGLENARIVLWSKILIKHLGVEMDGSTDEISRTAQ